MICKSATVRELLTLLRHRASMMSVRSYQKCIWVFSDSQTHISRGLSPSRCCDDPLTLQDSRNHRVCRSVCPTFWRDPCLVWPEIHHYLIWIQRKNVIIFLSKYSSMGRCVLSCTYNFVSLARPFCYIL